MKSHANYKSLIYLSAGPGTISTIGSSLLANLGLTMTMLIVAIIMAAKKLFVFGELTRGAGAEPSLLASGLLFNRREK